MIRDLKKFGDDEKQLMALKEQLQLAIKNDEYISSARANAQKGIPAEVSQEDQRTLAEQIADEDSQREQAQSKLSQLFRGQEVLAILSLLNKDQIVAINTLFNGIKDELKGVNTKLMLPKDFVLFLNKYIDDAVSLQGALTVGLNSIEEMKRIIPDPQSIDELMRFLRSRDKTNTLQLQTSELGKVLPTDANYNTIASASAIQQKNLIDEGNSLYPNKILLDKAVAEGNIGKIEKLLQAFTPARKDEIEKYLDKIKRTAPPKPARPSRLMARPMPRPRARSPIAMPRQSSVKLEKNIKNPIAYQAVEAFEEQITDFNKKFLAGMDRFIRTAIVKRRADSNYPLSPPAEKAYANFVSANADAVEELLSRYKGVERLAIERALGESGWARATPDVYEFVGSGIKMGRGRPPTDTPKVHKMKIGDGIKVYKKPVNIEFGNYVLNTNKLEKQILHLKGRSGGALSWFQPVPISDAFTELLNDMITTNTVNKHLLKSLDKDEQRIFYEVCDKSGLLKHFKLEKPEDTTEKDLMNTFQILLGEFKAGSNSPLLFQQLRKHIIYFTERGRIPKQKALAMLSELV